MTAQDASSWVCATCQLPIETRFCSNCGEQRPGAHDLTLVGLVKHVVETVAHLDGRLIRSLKSLMLRPGFLTEAYRQGRRKAFLGPLPLFLLANLAFFALQSWTGTHVFSKTLDSHQSQQLYSEFAREAVSDRIADLKTTLEVYAPVFDHAITINAKSFIILMVPPFGLLTMLLLARTRRPFVVHVIFALHFFAFVLLLICVMLPVTVPLVRLGISGASGSTLDAGFTLLQVLVCGVYLHVATRVVFGIGGLARVASVIAMVAATAGIIVGYRFVVFLITLYTTSV